MPMALAQPSRAVRCLKAEGGREVWLVSPAGGEAGPEVLKRWTLTPALAVKLLMGIAQPQRQVRGARRLARAGIPTPAIRGRWRLTRAGGRAAIEIRMALAEGRSPLALADEGGAPPAAARAVAGALGRLVAAMTAAGLFNRDLKLENLIVDERADPPVVWVIDPVGVRPMRRPAEQCARMLERLAVQHADAGRPIGHWAVMAVLAAALRPMRRRLRRRTMAHLRTLRRPRGG